ncbi:MAG: CxxC-x17-CxxC domain-containing protein [Candidatus Dormibacteria bacterium]
MAFEDMTLRCRDCAADFIWTAGEQTFFEQKGLQNQPQRCPNCRRSRRGVSQAGREMFDVVCADCGRTTQVPFEPRESRPVYCSDCFERSRVTAAS